MITYFLVLYFFLGFLQTPLTNYKLNDFNVFFIEILNIQFIILSYFISINSKYIHSLHCLGTSGKTSAMIKYHAKQNNT